MRCYGIACVAHDTTTNLLHRSSQVGSAHVASSLCRVLQELADGTAAVVQWRLQTGRTHQIRVHAQHIGCPLLGDDLYGGVGPILSKVSRGSNDR